MHIWNTTRRLALTAALGLLACRTSSSIAPPVPAPGDSFPIAFTDDENAVRSMAEGGQSDQPYVMDGTVQELTAHTILIWSDELGGKQLYVNPHTDITVDGEPAALSDVRPGMPIRAAYSPTKVAWALQAGQGATPDDARQR